MDSVTSIALLASLFVGSHLVISHPPIRERWIARLGFGGFEAVYSVVSVAIWVPLAWIWWTHRHAGTALWAPRGPVAVHGAELVSLVGLALIGASLIQPAPTSHLGGGKPVVRGIGHVTRHPLMMGAALLTGAHLVVNGWVGDLWFFGGHAVLALLGAAHQDQRHAATRPGYRQYLQSTTFLPNPLGLPKVDRRGWIGIAAGLAVGVALRYAHRWF